MKSDGVYDQLHEKWFGCRNAPFPIFVDDSAPRPDFVKRTVILEPSRCGHTVPSTYQIQLGETLGGLALRFYGDLYLWPCIQAANNIADVRRIPAGQVLSIPPLEQCRG
jgi:nucleoid-associated protein YgaU